MQKLNFKQAAQSVLYAWATAILVSMVLSFLSYDEIRPMLSIHFLIFFGSSLATGIVMFVALVVTGWLLQQKQYNINLTLLPLLLPWFALPFIIALAIAALLQIYELAIAIHILQLMLLTQCAIFHFLKKADPINQNSNPFS